mmetsp:Transcript_31016/g.101116  ORF Transcript_31016/g.101116 Transcript_31016/m.101116 type:complete len:472 (-) Transcript_31016:1778-3193(-)
MDPRPKVDGHRELQVDGDDHCRVEARARLHEGILLPIRANGALEGAVDDAVIEKHGLEHAVAEPRNPVVDGEHLLTLPLCVERRVRALRVLRDVLVEHADRDDGQRHKHHVVSRHRHVVVHRLAAVEGVHGVEEERETEEEVLVEEIRDEASDTSKVPAPVHEQEALEKFELCKRKIGSHDRLHALLARNPDPDVRRLDHPHVVGAVPDGERRAAGVLHQRGDERFLQRRHAAAHHSFTLAPNVEEEVTQLRVDGVRECAAVDDDGGGFLGRGESALDSLEACSDVGDRLLLDVVPALIPHRVGEGVQVDDINLHVRAEQRARFRDVDGGVLLVAGEDPQRHSRLRELLDTLRHAVLKLVLNGCRPEQHEILLDELRHLFKLRRSVRHRRLGLDVLLVPLLKRPRLELSARDAERPQSRRRVLLHVLHRLVLVQAGARAQPLVNDVVRSLAKEQEPPVIRAADDRHALAGA